MTANERRAEIMRIMTARRQESMGRLALELGVTRRTIRSDITALTVDYPLETQRGNGGCVKVADWYHPHRNILSCEQQRVLSELISGCDAYQANVLRQMLTEYPDRPVAADVPAGHGAAPWSVRDPLPGTVLCAG